MKDRKQKRSKVVAALALVVVVVFGGTFAYWSQTSSVENPFDTGKFSGFLLREDFIPEEGVNWQPGVEVNKDVEARNEGDTPLIIRAKLDETWTRKASATADAGQTYRDSDSTTDGYDVYTTSQISATDGEVAGDESVVEKNFSGSANWIKGTDGWYYYKVTVAAGEKTDKWLDSVTLLSDADMGKFETKHYVSASDDANESLWTWFEYTGTMPTYIDASGAAVGKDAPGAKQVLHNKIDTGYAQSGGKDLLGYSQSDYKLTVTTQAVQATQDGLDAEFGGGSTFTAPAGTTWTLED